MKTKTKQDEDLEVNFDEDSYEELCNMHKQAEEEQRNLEVTTSFFEQVSPHYTHKGETKNQYFNPMMDSAYRRGQQQGEYYVHYSFPNGTRYPVASFWLYWKNHEDKDCYRYVHVDLSSVVDNILRYYKDLGFDAPPERE
jgi:hypothetical protein